MSESLVDLVSSLSAKCAAYELVLIDLIFSAWPIEEHRNERRESACRALEQALEGVDPSSAGYLYVQRALATIEELYSTPGPPSVAQRP